MIRLTLNALSEPEFHLFNKSPILLGSDPSMVDLVLPGTDIQAIHLKIVEHNGFLVISNEANDPFASVNGHPFGKKLLNSGDIIMVLHTTLLFENLLAPPSHEGEGMQENTTPLLAEIKNNKQEACAQQSAQFRSRDEGLFPSFTLPFENEVERLNADELGHGSLDHYLKELEPVQETPQPSPIKPQMTETPPVERKKATSLKDDYLRDLEDDHAATIEPTEVKDHGHLYRAWKWIFLFILSAAVITGITGTITYFTVSDKTEAQETKAAQGVADLAIALTHAKLSYSKPQNQNWSDVEFLKSNLQAILPDTRSYASQIDAQGQFNCCPYTLRIYTSTDLSHFLLIAQPAPNLLYWLIPQSMIVVDSHLMELRTLRDVRTFNRLLANPDPLDGSNGKEITNLIKQGGLISLSTLAADSGNIDFTPPKNLAWILPGAENFLYNAPRYYRLGQSIVHQAINLSTEKGSSHEIAALKQNVDNFASLNHLILYSDQGKKSAALTQKSIKTFAPSNRLLFGYLLFNAKGKIHQVHLLEAEEEEAESLIGQGSKDTDNSLIAFQPVPEPSTREDPAIKTPENPLVDRDHPLFIQLQTLVTARENELKPLIAALATLINQELASPRAQFQVEYQNLSHTYLMANAKHKRILKENLESLFEKYENIPINQFLAYAQDLHLEHLIQYEEHALAVLDENCQQNMEALLTHIENSKSIAELNNIVHIATSWLNFDYIKDPHELMKYQNLLRNQLLEQLEKCLLTQKTNLIVKEEDKEILLDILNQERLVKPEERDFFLKEFEEKFHNLHYLEQLDGD